MIHKFFNLALLIFISFIGCGNRDDCIINISAENLIIEFENDSEIAVQKYKGKNYNLPEK
jgi:hypothetical protein